jgi:hypothetical protein
MAMVRHNLSKVILPNGCNEEERFESHGCRKLPQLLIPLTVRIVKFNPNVQALFLDNDIKNAIVAMYVHTTTAGLMIAGTKCFMYTHQKYTKTFFTTSASCSGNYNDMGRLK